MKKKLLSALLCLAMGVTMLAGCGGDSSATDSPAGTAGTEGGAPVAAETTFEGQKVVMAWFNWTGTPAGLDRVNEAISAYTQEKYGIEVEMQVVDAASYSQNITLQLTAGEQVDIYNVLPVGYTAAINKEYCYDLEENNLIQTYGQGILDTLDAAYVDACRVGGVLYGLPQQRDMAIGLRTYMIGAEYLEGIGYDYNSKYANEGDEIIFTDIDEIESIFAQLHEKYPDKYVFVPQETNLAQHPLIDAVGGDNFGVLLDPINSLQVSDFFSSDAFREECERMYKWNQAGYISQDALTDQTAATAQVQAGSAMAYGTASKPGGRQQESNLCGRPMIVFQCGQDFLRSSAVNTMVWCMNSNTDVPEAAMTVLNGFYTDPYLSNLICWGVEGVDYKKTDDGHITFADGVDASNAEYYNNVNWLLPNQFIAEIWEGDSLDIWTRMEAFNKNSAKSKALGFAFDNSAVSNEYTALTNVSTEYLKSLYFGFTDPATGIPEFVDKLQAAGLDTYIAAKQAAVDEWAAANGIQ